MSTSTETLAAGATRKGGLRQTGRLIEEWNPEDERFWETTGKPIARKNLAFSIFAEHIGFSAAGRKARGPGRLAADRDTRPPRLPTLSPTWTVRPTSLRATVAGGSEVPRGFLLDAEE